MDALESQGEALSNNLASISEPDRLRNRHDRRPDRRGPGAAEPGRKRAGLSPKAKRALPRRRRRRSRTRSPRPTRSPPPPTSGAAATAPSNPSGYDCSGAVCFALHGGGFLESPLDSTGLETWGEAGPGKWITVYANAEHAWMMIAGLAFDTVGGPGPRWHDPWVDSPEGFIVRHPLGLLASIRAYLGLGSGAPWNRSPTFRRSSSAPCRASPSRSRSPASATR